MGSTRAKARNNRKLSGPVLRRYMDPFYSAIDKWEIQKTKWTYQYTSPNYQMTQSYPMDAIPSGVRLVSKPGDPVTRYGAYVARLEDGTNWSPVLFKRDGAKIGSTPIKIICR